MEHGEALERASDGEGVMMGMICVCWKEKERDKTRIRVWIFIHRCCEFLLVFLEYVLID